jgi:hypothetical protein
MAASVGPARRGRRVQLQERPVAVVDAEPHLYVCGAKSLRLGRLTLHEGVEVPGAGAWLRIESWVAGRRVKRIKASAEHTSFKDFEAAESKKG